MGKVHQLILHQGVEEARRLLSSDKTDRLCVEAAYEVMADDRGKVGIAHAGFAMAALPHRRTAEPVWEREGARSSFWSRAALTAQNNRLVSRMVPSHG